MIKPHNLLVTIITPHYTRGVPAKSLTHAYAIVAAEQKYFNDFIENCNLRFTIQNIRQQTYLPIYTTRKVENVIRTTDTNHS